MQELAALWPMKRFPVLVDGARTVLEASIIIEYSAWFSAVRCDSSRRATARRSRCG